MSGKIIVSLDFELFWGMQDTSSLNSYGNNILGGRKAILKLLDMFEKYDIHATWATVGMMFAENSDSVKSFFPDKDLLPSYDDKKLSTYNCFDGIASDINYKDYFFAKDLIKEISQRAHQEIGSHTFSHYYCREAGQTIEQFKADMESAIKIANYNGFNVSSVVLPRNQSVKEYNNTLSELGFSSYRDEENDWIHQKIKNRKIMRALRLMDVYFPLTGYGGYIPKKENGIWNLMGSRMYKPYFNKLAFLEPLKLHRIKRQMLHAAKNNLVFHFWWHPHNIGVKTDFHLKQLDEIFSYYNYLNEKYGMESVNMSEMVTQLENK